MMSVTSEKFVLGRGPQCSGRRVRPDLAPLASRLAVLSRTLAHSPIPLRARTLPQQLEPQLDLSALQPAMELEVRESRTPSSSAVDLTDGDLRTHSLLNEVDNIGRALPPTTASAESPVAEKSRSRLESIATPRQPRTDTIVTSATTHGRSVHSVATSPMIKTPVVAPVAVQSVSSSRRSTTESAMPSDHSAMALRPTDESANEVRAVERITLTPRDQTFARHASSPSGESPLAGDPLKPMIEFREFIVVREHRHDSRAEVMSPVATQKSILGSTLEPMGEMRTPTADSAVTSSAMNPVANPAEQLAQHLARLKEVATTRDTLHIGAVQVVVRSNAAPPPRASSPPSIPVAPGIAAPVRAVFRNPWLARNRFD